MTAQGVAMPPEAAICARAGCGRPLSATTRLRGSPQKFCSPRCRRLNWEASHPRAGSSAVDVSPARSRPSSTRPPMLDRYVLGERIARRLHSLTDADIADVHAALDHLARTFNLSAVTAIERRSIPTRVIVDYWRRGRIEQLRFWKPPRTAHARARRDVELARRATRRSGGEVVA